MRRQLSYSAGMSEATVEESLFPFQYVVDIGFARAGHIPLANIAARSFGVPIGRNHQWSFRVGPSSVGQGPEVETAAPHLPHQGGMGGYQTVDRLPIFSSVGEEHAM